MAGKKNLKGLAIVATYISAGVKAGAGGFAIVNGKLVKIPPRGPAVRALNAAIMAIAGTSTGR